MDILEIESNNVTLLIISTFPYLSDKVMPITACYCYFGRELKVTVPKLMNENGQNEKLSLPVEIVDHTVSQPPRNLTECGTWAAMNQQGREKANQPSCKRRFNLFVVPQGIYYTN
jgi:hypothetical protein